MDSGFTHAHDDGREARNFFAAGSKLTPTATEKARRHPHEIIDRHEYESPGSAIEARDRSDSAPGAEFPDAAHAHAEEASSHQGRYQTARELYHRGPPPVQRPLSFEDLDEIGIPDHQGRA
jgi:hypothetical protein